MTPSQMGWQEIGGKLHIPMHFLTDFSQFRDLPAKSGLVVAFGE